MCIRINLLLFSYEVCHFLLPRLQIPKAPDSQGSSKSASGLLRPNASLQLRPCTHAGVRVDRPEDVYEVSSQELQSHMCHVRPGSLLFLRVCSDGSVFSQ